MRFHLLRLFALHHCKSFLRPLHLADLPRTHALKHSILIPYSLPYPACPRAAPYLPLYIPDYSCGRPLSKSRGGSIEFLRRRRRMHPGGGLEERGGAKFYRLDGINEEEER